MGEVEESKTLPQLSVKAAPLTKGKEKEEGKEKGESQNVTTFNPPANPGKPRVATKTSKKKEEEEKKKEPAAAAGKKQQQQLQQATRKAVAAASTKQ